MSEPDGKVGAGVKEWAADRRRSVNYASDGRNPNWKPTCQTCTYLDRGDRGPWAGGWCTNPHNRVPPLAGWPVGFTPSVSSTGGCDLHLTHLPSPSQPSE